MSKLNVKTWATDTLVRAVKTAAQTAVAALGVNATGLLHVDWAAVGSLAGLAAVTCVLQNLSNLNVDPTPAITATLDLDSSSFGRSMADTKAAVQSAPAPGMLNPDAPAPAVDAPPAQ